MAPVTTANRYRVLSVEGAESMEVEIQPPAPTSTETPTPKPPDPEDGRQNLPDWWQSDGKRGVVNNPSHPAHDTPSEPNKNFEITPVTF